MLHTLECRLRTVLGLIVGMFVLASALAGPVQGQTYRASQDRQDRGVSSAPDRERGGADALPAWAEPAERPSRGARQGSAGGSGGVGTKAVPPPPTSPEPVPVDGGLLWLVLAGGGYASWKLAGGEAGGLF